jgi:hypothetical protein
MEPGLMSTVAVGGTGTQVDGQGSTGRGERGTVGDGRGEACRGLKKL